MKAEEAYHTVRRVVEADPRRQLRESYFDDQHFGSFVVGFEENGQLKAVVNDKGIVSVCAGLDGIGPPLGSLVQLYEADEESLLRALGL